VQDGTKSGTHAKVIILPCWPVFHKTVADMHGHATYHNKH